MSGRPVRTARLDRRWWSPAGLRALRARCLARRAGEAVGMTSGTGVPWRVAAAYPHDPLAFTQGLAWHDGSLYESTGLEGRSTLREVDLESGRSLRVRRLPRHYFGEGIAVWERRIVQLTWRSGVAVVYDRATFEPVAEPPIAGEGWGLARLGERLVLSDGSATLRLLAPESLAEVGRLDVRLDGRPLGGLNDLEAAAGALWANLFGDSRIARVDPETGAVTGLLELGPLCALPENRGRGNVLNGVAWRVDIGRLLVTGKRWPRLFELELGT